MAMVMAATAGMAIHAEMTQPRPEPPRPPPPVDPNDPSLNTGVRPVLVRKATMPLEPARTGERERARRRRQMERDAAKRGAK